MIEKILVNNFATIKDLELDFNSGFSALTGETGAGKSIIIDALGLLLGNRALDSYIRTGEDQAKVQGVFVLDGQEYIISRTLNRGGRNTIKVNGEIFAQKELLELGSKLVKISAQFDNQELLDEEVQFELLNSFALGELEQVRTEYQSIFPEYSKIREQIVAAHQADKSEEHLEFLKFQTAELKEAAVEVGELSQLEAKAKDMKVQSDASQNLEQVVSINNDSILNGIEQVQELTAGQELLVSVNQSFISIKEQVLDVQKQLKEQQVKLEFDPQNFTQINERLEIIRNLERKYKKPADELPGFLNDLEDEIKAIENSTIRVKQLNDKFSSMRAKLLELAENMHEIRTTVGNQLARSIETNLAELLLEHAKFEIRVDKTKTLTLEGFDSVSFWISTNPGQDLGPMNTNASGGEISRVLLAVSSVFADVISTPTLVFDEIDTGVSGRAASAIAKKMQKIASDKQVLSITHLPQVAAKSDYQYEITKVIENDQTYSTAQLLDRQHRVTSIAKLLSGEHITDVALENAKELLN